MMFRYTCVKCVLILLILVLAVNGDKSIDDYMHTCTELCDKCEGIGFYGSDGCECHIDSKNSEVDACIETIKNEAAQQNLSLVTIQPKLLNRMARCCSTNSRFRLIDILRIAKYFMNNGPQTGTCLLGNGKNFEDTVIDTGDWLRCLDDADASDSNVVMPGEEPTDNYSQTFTPSYQYIMAPQSSYPFSNACPCNNYNDPHVANTNQMQSLQDCCHLALNPSTSLHEYSHNQLSSLYPPSQLSPQNLRQGHITPPLTYPSSSNYFQNSLIRNPLVKPQMSGTLYNSIGNPSYLYPSHLRLPNTGGRMRYRSEVSNWQKPIVQPFHTLVSPMISPNVHQPQFNNLQWHSSLPRTHVYDDINPLLAPHDTYASTGNNYLGDTLLGAANPNVNGNKNNNEGSSSVAYDMTTENYNENQNPSTKSVTRSDIVIKPEQTTLSSQRSTIIPSDGGMFGPNGMKRTIPVSLRYGQMNKRELKMKAS